MVGKSLLADASAADASVEIDLGHDRSAVWISYEMDEAFATEGSYMTAWDPTHVFTVDFTLISSDGLGTYWAADSGFAYAPAPAANRWQTIETQHVNGGATAMYVDGTLVASGTDGVGRDVRFVQFGLFSVFTPAGTSLAYIRNVKVGPTRGSGAYFAWPDTETDLDAWTTVTGSVAVVRSPDPPAPFALAPATPDTLTLTPASTGTLTLTSA